jgi:predicted metal-dependent hydrolase
MTQKIESAIANVQTAFPSIFSKEDVVSILEGLLAEVDSEEETEVVTSGLNEDQISELIQKIQESISRKMDRMDTSDLVDTSTAEFNINYGNTLELESVDVNGDYIADEVNEVVDEEIRNYFETLAAEEEAETGTPYASEQ